VERTHLSNGIAVLLCHLPDRAVTAVQLHVAAPRELEPSGLDGVAAITGKALREGTTRHDAEAFAEELERRGATFDSGAGHAGIRVGLAVAVSRLEAAMTLVTDALATPAFPEREVRRLVRLRLDAIDRELADPRTRAQRETMATLYDHAERIARPDEGDRDTVARITRDDVVAHRTAHVLPAATTVVIAGDLSGGDVVDVLERTLGTWSDGRAPASPARRTPLTSPERQVVLVHRPGAAQTELRFARVGSTRHEPRWAATTLGCFALGGGMSSRLMRTLREQRGYTYGISAGAASLGTTGVLQVAAAVETGVTRAAVEEALTVIADLARGGVTKEERDFGVDSLSAVPRRLETSHAVAALLIGAVEEGLPDDFFRTYHSRLETTTVDEVIAAVARDWRPGLSLVAVGDADVIAEPLRAVGLGDVHVVD
jgi:predicted Zn-dependent peptidase